MNTIQKPRNSSLDVLRILSMLLIILLHSIIHSDLETAIVPGTGIFYIEKYIQSMSQVCVNLYILISGYFMINTEFKCSKLFLLWIEAVFYSIGIKVILMAGGAIDFSAVSLVSCLFPITTGRYWFLTIYFGLYLLAPFLNIAIKNM